MPQLSIMSKRTNQRSPEVVVNNSATETSPRPPSMGALARSTAGGLVLGSTQPAPLLVLARFQAIKQLTKNNSHGVTPFWHNDTQLRVTVTFGARRIVDAAAPRSARYISLAAVSKLCSQRVWSFLVNEFRMNPSYG